MSESIESKHKELNRRLRETGGLAVAFSGGVDSTFLAAAAVEALGDRALAVTAASSLYPAHEQKEARNLAKQLGIRHIVVESDELDLPGFADNPPNRCYLCKHGLFELVGKIAAEHGIDAVADGTNADDVGDYRPGRQAAIELGVLSPLLEVQLTKDEIRELSRQMALPTADKPAFACLGSRFPYGDRITEEKLKAVDALEAALRKLRFRQLRVRHHGEIARIEVEPTEIERLASEPVRTQVLEAGRRAGFQYVALDLQGYRTGSMNETL